jgi:hypothetical protein
MFDRSVVAVSNEAMTVCQYQAAANGGKNARALRCARYDVGGTQVARASTAIDAILDGPHVTNDSVFALSSRDHGFVLHTLTLASTSTSDQVPVVVPSGVFPDWIMPLRGAPVTGVMLMDRVSDALRADPENVRTMRFEEGTWTARDEAFPLPDGVYAAWAVERHPEGEQIVVQTRAIEPGTFEISRRAADGSWATGAQALGSRGETWLGPVTTQNGIYVVTEPLAGSGSAELWRVEGTGLVFLQRIPIAGWWVAHVVARDSGLQLFLEKRDRGVTHVRALDVSDASYTVVPEDLVVGSRESLLDYGVSPDGRIRVVTAVGDEDCTGEAAGFGVTELNVSVDGGPWASSRICF